LPSLPGDQTLDLQAELLDGDITNFSQELSFTKRECDINVKRIGFLSWFPNKHDIISVVAAIAPYEERTPN